MNDSARFKLEGSVIRKWVANSGKFAKATIEVQGMRTRKIEVRAFREQVEAIGKLGVGEVVQVVGEVETEALKDKKGVDVKVDGFQPWVIALTVTSIKNTNEATRAPTPKKEAAPVDDSDIPF